MYTVIYFIKGSTKHIVLGEFKTRAEAEKLRSGAAVVLEPQHHVQPLLKAACADAGCEKCDQPYL